jgi:hypothetical protein
MTFRRSAIPALALLGMAMCAGCSTPRPLGTFGLASSGAKPGTLQEIGEAGGESCTYHEVDYAEAVEDAIRRRPPANALVDARFSVSQWWFRVCAHVEGMAVVIP